MARAALWLAAAAAATKLHPSPARPPPPQTLKPAVGLRLQQQQASAEDRACPESGAGAEPPSPIARGRGPAGRLAATGRHPPLHQLPHDAPQASPAEAAGSLQGRCGFHLHLMKVRQAKARPSSGGTRVGAGTIMPLAPIDAARRAAHSTNVQRVPAHEPRPPPVNGWLVQTLVEPRGGAAAHPGPPPTPRCVVHALLLVADVAT